MKCYYHAQSDAVAICKNCQRGLCHEDAVDVGNGIACKDRCEDQVRAVNALIDTNLSMSKRSKTTISFNALVYIVLGLLCIALGSRMSEFDNLSTVYYFFLAGGFIFVAYGLYIMFLRSRVSLPKR